MAVILMLIVFVVLLFLSLPVSFSILAASIVYFIYTGLPAVTIIQRLTGGVNSFTLLAIPGFILAGELMNTGGITTRIFNFAKTPLRHVTGGLGHANVVASIIFAGMTGSAIADTAGLGSIELKAMKDAGYDEDFSLAITGASSTIGPIIPPSIPMVLYGVAAGASIGRLFMGGFLPGLLMGAIMCVMVYLQCRRKNYVKESRASISEVLSSFVSAFFPLMTPVIIIGGMMSGVFTPTEAAVVAIVYALILCIVYRTLTWRDFIEVLARTVKQTVPVMLVVAAANIFAWILSRERIPSIVLSFFSSYIHNKVGMLLMINLFLLIVGCFLDPPVAIPIITPVLLPLVMAYNVDIVHFGVIMVLNLMIGLLTPPIGMILFVLSSVASVPFERVVKAVIPYIICLLISLMLVTFWPQMVMLIPNLVFG